MRLRALGRHRGLVLATLLAAAVTAFQQRRHRVPLTRFEPPAFDSYVYLAMAENPAFFTAAPWGYRVLVPWIAHAWPQRAALQGFRLIALAALTANGALLFLFLRRLGHGELPSLAAVAAFGFTPPLVEVLRNPVLGEPAALALESGLLFAVEAGCSLAPVALLVALGLLTKETFLLFPPLVFLARRERDGAGKALALALVTAVPALALVAAQRLWWTPYLHPPRAPLDLELARAGLEVLRRSFRETGQALLLGGLAPLALLGALRPAARPYLARYGYLLAALPGLALLGWVNVPSAQPVPLFGRNTLRLLSYALPVVLPLALLAVDRLLPHRRPPVVAWAASRPRTALCAAGLVAVLVLPFAAFDRYRRVPLHEPRDGPLVLALCGESLRTARLLARGEAVSFELAQLQFNWGESDPGQLRRMRWFLRDGWGLRPHYGTGPAVAQAAEAGLLLPSLAPRDLEAELLLWCARPRRVAVRVNDRAVGELRAGPGTTRASLRVPGAALFQGDNRLSLVSADGEAIGLRLDRLTYRPAR